VSTSDDHSKRSVSSRLWPFLRLVLVSLCVWAAGYACASAFRSAVRAVLAPVCIAGGFLAVTVGAWVRLKVPRWRQRLAGRPALVVLLCAFLLGLQAFETVANAESQPLWYCASFLFPPPSSPNPTALQKLRGGIGDALLGTNRILTDYQWHENVWPKVAVLLAAQLAIGLLWGMRARELAVGSALFWVWAVAYFVAGLRTFGHHWGVSFWGQGGGS